VGHAPSPFWASVGRVFSYRGAPAPTRGMATKEAAGVVPPADETQMRDLVREVMAEPVFTDKRADVRTIKSQVQQLKSEFASIRSDFMQMLRRPRGGTTSGASTPRSSAMPDYRPQHQLAFSLPPQSELIFGKPVPPFAVRFADEVSTQGLPATKLWCAMCPVNSGDEVAQILFGETEVILRGGVAEFSGVTLGRLASMKKGGTLRLRVSSHDPTCPYAVVPLFSAPIDVRNKPSASAKAAAATSALPAPAPAAPPVSYPPPSQAAALLKRKPPSSDIMEKSYSPPPARWEGEQSMGAPPQPGGPSWMERMRPSTKKTYAHQGAPPPPGPSTGGRPVHESINEESLPTHSSQVNSLASDLDRVSMGFRTGQPSPPSSPGRAAAIASLGMDPSTLNLHGSAGPAPEHDILAGTEAAMPGGDLAGLEPPPPMLADFNQPSSQTLHGALQRLGSSSLLELASNVLDSSDLLLPGSPGKSPGAPGVPQPPPAQAPPPLGTSVPPAIPAGHSFQ